MLIPEQTEQTQSQNKPKRLGVPANPKRGVEVTITKFEYFPSQGNTPEKVILTVENDEVPHYIDILEPGLNPVRIDIICNEIKAITKECGITLEDKFTPGTNPSFQEYCEYYLLPCIGKEGRIKIVYQSNKVVFSTEDPKNTELVGKPVEEIKRLRKPYTKTGKAPYFFGKGNDKDFTIVSKGDKWDDFVDYDVEIKAPDSDFGQPAVPADLPF